MANHSSILVWRIPWTEEPGGLQFMGLKESDTTEGLTILLHSRQHAVAEDVSVLRDSLSNGEKLSLPVPYTKHLS